MTHHRLIDFSSRQSRLPTAHCQRLTEERRLPMNSGGATLEQTRYGHDCNWYEYPS